MKKILAGILALTMMLSLTACSLPGLPFGGVFDKSHKEKAGEYTLFAIYFEDEDVYVEPEAFEMPATLSLDNKGRGILVMDEDIFTVDDWRYEDGKIEIDESGETIYGEFDGDVMVLDFEDGNYLLFAKEDVDISKYSILTADEYFNGLAYGDKAGEYTLFAVYLEEDGVYIEPEALEMPCTLTLADDGTGELYIVDEKFDIYDWSYEDGKIEISESGETIYGVFEGDVMNLDFEEGNFLLFAQDGVDTSMYDVLSLEEYIDFLNKQQLGE